MQADLFYSLDEKPSIPLVLLYKDDEKFQDLLSPFELQYLENKQYKGELGEICLIYNTEGEIQKAFIGAREEKQAEVMAIAALNLPEGCYSLSQPLSSFAIQNWSYAQYRFDKYKKSKLKFKQLQLSERQRQEIMPLVESVFFTRDLINTPANDMRPMELSQAVADLAKTYQGTYKEWVGNDLLKHNFPAIHAVGRASIHEPRLAYLSWGSHKHPKISLVGKGVCFDSGGLNIKPYSPMRLMKKDMGGAAIILGLAKWIMSVKLPVYLEVWIPAVENSISSDAFRPGDVLTMRNGKTVEIDNTDAEGRLVLADAMTVACETNPELLIDASTLTGAARVAVGTEISAMFSPNDELAEALYLAGQKEEDPVWRFPLYEGYQGMLDSSIADLINASPSFYAGAITAALFLQYFIEKNITWVHFDMMAWNVGNKPGKPEGGEAMALRAISHYLQQQYKK